MFSIARKDLGDIPETNSMNLKFSDPLKYFEIFSNLVFAFNIKAYKHFFFIRKVADDLANGHRDFPYEGWNCQYLIALCKFGVQQQIYDLYGIFALQMLFRVSFDVVQRF